MQNIVIVGASLAGTRAAQALRSNGFAGRVTFVGEESELPYDRPPLSKQFFLGESQREDIRLLTEDDLGRLDLDVRLDTAVVRLDPHARRLHTSRGEIDYDGLVVATGARPRTLPGTVGGPRIHVLRTAADAVRLREQIRPGTRLGVLGGGLLGSEVASSAAALGAEVTVVERDPAPMSQVLGDLVGGQLAHWHRTHGIDLRTGTPVMSVVENLRGGVEVELPDAVMVFDQVLVAFGAVPNTEWLEGSGLTLDDGLVCDENLFAFQDSVVAAGDVARIRDAHGLLQHRVEHWTNAALQGEAAATNLLAGRSGALPVRAVPYVWSDQFGSRIEIVGSPRGTDEVEKIWTAADGRARLYLYRREGEVTALVGINAMRWMVGVRRDLRQMESLTHAVVAQLELNLTSAS
jgi:NADPH-dependent 2,4-dienoyl-CoA reductase/sulfur reductase-like enzyme